MVAQATTYRRSVLDRIAGAVSTFFEIVVDTSTAMRCAREAERLFALSDEELARRGLTRDGVITHAFARYFAA